MTGSGPQRTRRLVASVVFTAGVVALVFVLTGVLTPRSDSKDMWAGYRSLAPDSVDVLIVGNSHAFTSIAPMQLWRDHHITSWDIGASAINTRMKRAYIEEALKTQRPKVIALELYSVLKPTLVGDKENHWAYDYMPLGLSKILAISDTVEPVKWERALLPLEQYHQNYATLDRKDASRFLGTQNGASTGGATALVKSAAAEGDGAATSDEQDATSAVGPASADSGIKAQAEADSTREVARIAAICRSKGIRLVLWLAPVEQGYLGTADPLPALQRNIGSDFPEVVFVNTNEHKSEIGLVPADFRGWGHLYAWGMRKNTEWFATTVLAPLGVAGPSTTPDAKWWDAQSRKWDPPAGPA